MCSTCCCCCMWQWKCHQRCCWPDLTSKHHVNVLLCQCNQGIGVRHECLQWWECHQGGGESDRNSDNSPVLTSVYFSLSMFVFSIQKLRGSMHCITFCITINIYQPLYVIFCAFTMRSIQSLCVLCGSLWQVRYHIFDIISNAAIIWWYMMWGYVRFWMVLPSDELQTPAFCVVRCWWAFFKKLYS